MVEASVLAVLRALDTFGAFSIEDGISGYGLEPGAMEAAAELGFAAKWITGQGDTGKYQITAAGWSEVQNANNPPAEEPPAEPVIPPQEPVDNPPVGG